MEKNILIIFGIIILIFYIFNSRKNNTIKKTKKNYLFNTNIGKLIKSLSVTNKNINNNNLAKYKQSNFIKKNGLYTITTTLSDNFDKNSLKEESLMTIFTDKPHREVKKISMTEGLLKIFKDDHLNENIKNDHPNGIINLITDNGDVKSFAVTFTGCSPAASDSLLAYIRGYTDKNPTKLDHYKHLTKKDKEILDKIYQNIKNMHNLKSFEKTMPKFTNKGALKLLYGDKFMDKILRQTKISFKFLDNSDESKFENIVNNNFDEISNVSLFIDSECPFWTAAACLATKASIIVASLPEIGPAEVAAAISTAALKDVLQRIVRKFVKSSVVSSIVNDIISCSPLTPVCIVGPIVNYIYGCTC